MKYCWKCGVTLNDTARFCEMCGAVQNGGAENPVPSTTYIYHNYKEKTDGNRMAAFIISLLTSPILLVIRLLGQESEMKPVKTEGGGIKFEHTYLPEGIVVAMYVFLVISVIVVIALGFASKSNDRSKSLITKLLVLFNIVFALIIANI